MNRRACLKRSLEVESVEEKCLLSITTPAAVFATEAAALLPAHVVHASVQANDTGGLDGPALHALCKHRARSNNFSLVPVSTSLPLPEARVQVDNVGLVNGATYPAMSVLEVVNQTGTTIIRDRFKVGVAGSSFERDFPAQAWRPGTVQVFFATTNVQFFTFRLAGPVKSIPPNVYFRVTYTPSTFTATLHNLINSSHGVGGRFALQG